MIKIRKAENRGLTRFDWLQSYHSFSFGGYQDLDHQGFNTLRVINDDYISAGGGFAEHPHKNMEILTYVISGSLTHRDSLGSVAEIKAGEAQLMSAGKGIWHSEFNASKTEQVHLLQIWIHPDVTYSAPSYQQVSIAQTLKNNNLVLLAAKENAPLLIKQNLRIYLIKSKSDMLHELNDQAAWLQLISGELSINSLSLKAGDGLAIQAENSIKAEIRSSSAEYLLFHFNS